MSAQELIELEGLASLKMNPAFVKLIEDFEFLFVDLVVEKIAAENEPLKLSMLAAQLKVAKGLLKIFQERPSEAAQKLEVIKKAHEGVKEITNVEYGWN